MEPPLQESEALTVRRAGSLVTLVDEWMKADAQVACAYNNTRRSINTRWRAALGFTTPLHKLERLICLFNDRSRNVYNGTLLTVLEVIGETEHGWKAIVEDDGGTKKELNLWVAALGGQEWKSEGKPTDHVVVDYSYAITVHKSQGEQ